MVTIGHNPQSKNQRTLPVIKIKLLVSILFVWVVVLLLSCSYFILNNDINDSSSVVKGKYRSNDIDGEHHSAVLRKRKVERVSKAHTKKVEMHQDLEEGKVVRFYLDNLDGVEGNEGVVVVRTRPSWAPLGEKRFIELVASGFFSGCRFFRVVPNFMVQIGLNGNPQIQAEWRKKLSIKDDPVLQTNARGTISFATSGQNTRQTQIFINTRTSGNAYLDKEGFSPFAEVIEGMEFVDRICSKHRENPKQGMIGSRGNSYLLENFPDLSFIVKAEIVDD